jgi:hypothetical protein
MISVTSRLSSFVGVQDACQAQAGDGACIARLRANAESGVASLGPSTYSDVHGWVDELDAICG